MKSALCLLVLCWSCGAALGCAEAARVPASPEGQESEVAPQLESKTRPARRRDETSEVGRSDDSFDEDSPSRAALRSLIERLLDPKQSERALEELSRGDSFRALPASVPIGILDYYQDHVGHLSSRKRRDLLRALALFRHPSALLLFAVVLDEFPAEGASADQIAALRAVCGALASFSPSEVGENEAASVRESMRAVFERFDPHERSSVIEAIDDAFLVWMQPSWAPLILETLDQAQLTKGPRATWDVGSRVVLSLRAAALLTRTEAAEPILRLRFHPGLGPSTRLYTFQALFQLAAATSQLAEALLRGQRPDLKRDYEAFQTDYQRWLAQIGLPASAGRSRGALDQFHPTPFLLHAVVALGASGVGDPRLLEGAFPQLNTLESQLVVLQAVADLPHTSETRRIFSSLFRRVIGRFASGSSTTSPFALLRSVESLFDDSYVPLLLEGARRTPHALFKLRFLSTAIALMNKKQSEAVQRTIAAHAGSLPNRGQLELEYRIAHELLERCGEDEECYLQSVESQAEMTARSVVEQKSVLRLGILGLARTAASLGRLSRSVRLAPTLTLISELVLHRSPRGELESPRELLERHRAATESNHGPPRYEYVLRTRRALSR